MTRAPLLSGTQFWCIFAAGLVVGAALGIFVLAWVQHELRRARRPVLRVVGGASAARDGAGDAA